jgi:hypothetical protein
MSTFLVTLGWGFLALLGAAVLVATWEHLRSKSNLRQPMPPPQARRAAHLDLNLDQLLEPDSGDQAQRKATLGGALDRMAKPSAAVAHNPAQAWIETEPMVAESLQVELPADSARH